MLALFDLPQSSTIAPRIDLLYDFIFWISAVSFVGIVAGMLWFIWRYRRSRSNPHTTPYIEGHTPLELAVSVGLFVLVMVIFAWGWIDYAAILRGSASPLEINILGRQWLWEVEYANGRKSVNELVVPRGKPVKLLLASADVIHSFYVPAFRLKQDVVPGAYTALSFTPTAVGEYPAYCAEYCGTAHSSMIAKVRVVEVEEYERWKRQWELEQQLGVISDGVPAASAAETNAAAVDTPVERGKRLFAEKGCNACHALTAQKLVGPGLAGVFGSELEIEGGKKVRVDENYIRKSLMDPQADIVKGYQPVMPTYRGQLTDEEVTSLMAFIKSLK